MIQLIGVQRLAAIFLLLLVNGAAGAAYFVVLEPLRAQAETDFNAMKNQVAKLRSDIYNMKEDLKRLKAGLIDYEALKKNGYFAQQDRFLISRELEEVRLATELGGFSFDISSIQSVPNADVEKAGYKLQHSKIIINNVVSYTDQSFFDFLRVYSNDFPGHGRVASYTISRKGDVTPAELQQVRNRESVSLIDARAELNWFTMVPDAQKADQNTGFRGR